MTVRNDGHFFLPLEFPLESWTTSIQFLFGNERILVSSGFLVPEELKLVWHGQKPLTLS